MRYECPKCRSMKKPKIIKYFPPIVVECTSCYHQGPEGEFIKHDNTVPYDSISHHH